MGTAIVQYGDQHSIHEDIGNIHFLGVILFTRIQIPVVVKQFFNSFILTVYDGRYSIFSGLNSLPLITTNQVCTTQVVSVKRQLISAILIRSVKMKTFQNAGKSII